MSDRASPAPTSLQAGLLAAAITLFFGASLLSVDTARGIGSANTNPTIETLTVRVTADGCGTLRIGSGTRVGDGAVLTAAHVVAGTTTVFVTDSTGYIAEAEVVGQDINGVDVALLRVAPDLAPVTRGVLGTHAEAVAFAGHPAGGLLTAVVAEGFLVEAKAFGQVGESLISIGAEPAEGVSGGPVVDGAGRVVGVVVSVNTVNATGLAVPVSELGALLDERVAPIARC